MKQYAQTPLFVREIPQPPLSRQAGDRLTGRDPPSSATRMAHNSPRPGPSRGRCSDLRRQLPRRRRPAPRQRPRRRGSGELADDSADVALRLRYERHDAPRPATRQRRRLVPAPAEHLPGPVHGGLLVAEVLLVRPDEAARTDDAQPAYGLAGREAAVLHHVERDERAGAAEPRLAVHCERPGGRLGDGEGAHDDVGRRLLAVFDSSNASSATAMPASMNVCALYLGQLSRTTACTPKPCMMSM
jgi:hypothetical protein